MLLRLASYQLTNQEAVRAAASQRDSRTRNSGREPYSGLNAPTIGDQLNQRSARALVYGRLQGAIVRCAIEPGAGLSEKSIALAYGVSRTPVGEALQQLATDGLVIIRPQQRTVVSRISASRVQEACFVAELVGRIAVTAAAEIGVRSHREFLKALLGQQRAMAQSGNVSGFLDSELRFHAELVGLSGLDSLREIAQSTQAHMGRILALSSPDAGAMMDLTCDNLEVFNALRRNDAEGAADALCSRSKKTARLLPGLAARHPSYFEAEQPAPFQLQLGCFTVALRQTKK